MPRSGLTLTETLVRFTFNQIVKHLRIATHDLAKVDYMPASKAVRPQLKPQDQKNSPLWDDSITTRNLGALKEPLQKRGLSGLQSEKIPVPRLAANPTLTTPGKTP